MLVTSLSLNIKVSQLAQLSFMSFHSFLADADIVDIVKLKTHFKPFIQQWGWSITAPLLQEV